MDVDAMVTALRAATGAEREVVLDGLFAETVVLRHVPSYPKDGPLPGKQLTAQASAERALFSREIPGYTSTHTYESSGDGAIIERYHMQGTFPDGEVLDNPMRITFDVSDGAIVAMTAEIDAASVAGLGKVIAAAGGLGLDDADSTSPR